MTGFTLLRDGARLQGTDDGEGPLALAFQHGLGGSEAQVAENLPALPHVRRLTLECRAQGRSEAGATRPFSIALFAADALAACDARGLDRFVAGGISMGAAIALRLAVLHPERVRGLILARPAWAFEAAPANMALYAQVADLLRRVPSAECKARFAESPTGRMLADRAPDNLASLLGFFDRPDPALTADLLADIAASGQEVSQAEAAGLRVPVLVIGHGVDVAHPLATAEALAGAIPGARLVRIPPKATHKADHTAAFQEAVRSFLAEADFGVPSAVAQARTPNEKVLP